ncbi:MAG: nitroreductase family protein [Dehalococcoidia bacterium]
MVREADTNPKAEAMPATELTVSQAIMNRVSKRAFLPKPVEEEKLRLILEAGRWAPSSANSQPWRIIAVKGAEALARLYEALSPGNAWAKAAPVIIVVAGSPAEAGVLDGKEYYIFYCGLATENILLQTAALGLMGHAMVGWSEQKVREALYIPQDIRVMTLIAVGYQGSSDELDEENRAKDMKPRQRRPLEDVIFYDRWPEGAGATG